MSTTGRSVTTTRTWTFGRSIAIGFAAVVALNLVVAGIALIGLRSVVAGKDKVIDADSRLVLDVQKLLTIRDARAAANRGYLISGQQPYLDAQRQYDDRFEQQLQDIRTLVDTARGHQLLDQVAQLQQQFVQLDREPVALRQKGASFPVWSAAWDKINAQRTATAGAMNTLSDYQSALVEARKQDASAAAAFDRKMIVTGVLASVLASALLASTLTRRLRRRIGGAVGKVASSSAELQSTADQQAAGAKGQATAMNEISSTVTELLVTAQQIAESAQEVAAVADQTAGAEQAGRSTVLMAQESMAEIRGQVDAIIERMAELGDKSQRIESVLDIVSALAEQTTILAINSTIESVGAGESGRRFAVVADEIRKLADRVAMSTKEIRELIDGVRRAVDSSVKATDLGSRAVDTGSAQVGDVAAVFEQIADQVRSTMLATREIEMSTRQQSIAVEQVTLAVTSVAQTTRETESSTSQTLQTASQLRELSTNLRGLVEAGAH
jgi:methyl-accepting chemotaxis protein/CHASE3 domain sensor protein